MDTAIVLFTRDLRVQDHPALAAAARDAQKVVPLFVFDDRIFAKDASPNRTAFLLDALEDLDRSVKGLGAGLVVRRGDVAAETVRLAEEGGAEAVYCSEDVSAFAQARQKRLRKGLQRRELRLFPGVGAVPPGDIVPAGKRAFTVFTPFWRRWEQESRRPLEGTPERLNLPTGVKKGRLPALKDLVGNKASAQIPSGGESAARKLLHDWVHDDLSDYPDNHDALAADRTSKLSPHLHFGCLSPLEAEAAARGRAGSEAFIRQLCWRDFFHQLLAAEPQTALEDLRKTDVVWRTDPDALEAWKSGMTGYPIVDAGMRQLAGEGWMHNRARLVTASFLTRNLGIDWRHGAAHFMDLLIDGDVANNSGNWQWVAGTGANRRPNRVMNPLRQAERFDPGGDYVRRHIPELAHVEGKKVHRPWKLDEKLGYPLPIIDPDD